MGIEKRMHWKLDPTDITSEVCNRCIKKGPPHCCEIILGTIDTTASALFELVERAIEGYDSIRISNGQINLICSHLDQENGVCKIYEDRPQLCADFNCVEWAKVDFSRGAPPQHLNIYNKVVNMFREERDRKLSISTLKDKIK